MRRTHGVVSEVERRFVLEAMQQDLRPDGRRPFDVRRVALTFGDVPGVVEVTAGKTRTLGIVTAELIKPFPDRPTEGFLNFNVEFSPMASAAFENGARASEMGVETVRIVERAIRECRAVDTEALCVVAGEKVWSVRCDVHVIDHDGNLTDAVNLAAVAALLSFRRPDITVEGKKVIVHPASEKEMVPLSIHHVPICITFGFIAGIGKMVVDPTMVEEATLEGTMTMTLNGHHEVCTVQKSGGAPLTIEQIITCSHIAAVKANELMKVLDLARTTHDTRRTVKSVADLFRDIPKVRAPHHLPVISGPAYDEMLAGFEQFAGELLAAQSTVPGGGPRAVNAHPVAMPALLRAMTDAFDEELAADPSLADTGAGENDEAAAKRRHNRAVRKRRRELLAGAEELDLGVALRSAAAAGN